MVGAVRGWWMNWRVAVGRKRSPELGRPSIAQSLTPRLLVMSRWYIVSRQVSSGWSRRRIVGRRRRRRAWHCQWVFEDLQSADYHSLSIMVSIMAHKRERERKIGDYINIPLGSSVYSRVKHRISFWQEKLPPRDQYVKTAESGPRSRPGPIITLFHSSRRRLAGSRFNASI